MEVSREKLERSLEKLSGQVADRLAGIHGPGTLAWYHGREVANFIGAGRAVLLQLAHPPVAAAIAEHSKTFVDLRGRFERTFAIVFAMTFGDLDQALSSARRLHRIHDRVRGRLASGRSYAANSRDSLRWVYATLIDSVFEVRRFCGEPLSPAVCERYYRETKRFALLFGLDADDLPTTYAAFRGYMNDSVGGELTSVSTEAREMGRALLAPPHPLLSPLVSVFRQITGALLPEELAVGFDVAVDETGRKRAQRRARLIRAALGGAPDQLRFFPDYLDAMARVGLRSGPVRRLDRASQRFLPTARSLRLRA